MTVSRVDELEGLAKLYQSGALTDEEFERAKQTLIFADPLQSTDHGEVQQEQEQPSFGKKFLVAAILIVALAAAFYAGVSWQTNSTAWTTDASAGSGQTAAISLVKLAKEMDEFASQRAAREQNSAERRQAEEMSAHFQRWNYNILTGESVRKKHAERNAILQRSADRVGSTVALLRGALPLSEALEELQGKELDSELTTAETQAKLKAAIARSLSAFRASPLITRNERRRFEKQFEEAR